MFRTKYSPLKRIPFKNGLSAKGFRTLQRKSKVRCGVRGKARRATLKSIIKKGLQRLTDIAFAPGLTERFYVTEQHLGRIRIVEKGRLLKKPMLDIGKVISKGFEQGLLSLAFHPNFATNRKFYIFWTDKKKTVHIDEYNTEKSGKSAILSSKRRVMSVLQPESNHNGGGLRFGKDGYLYIGLGDGGGGGDHHGKYGFGQKKNTLLGKILRIDVNRRDKGKAYAVPKDNPFVGKKQFLPEIYHWGLRNPWRLTIDSVTGGLWVGDVGQNKIEELDYSAQNQAGKNFGWRCKEGKSWYQKDPPCLKTTLTDPVVHLPQKILASKGVSYCSIIVGHVYRGCALPSYRGYHFYGDWCANHLRGFRWDEAKAHGDRALFRLKIAQLTSVGEDHKGELYFVTWKGKVFKLVPEP